MNNFVPLRIVSCYSFLKSGLTIERIKSAVLKNEYFGLGLCDLGTMYGVPSFVKASEEIGKPYLIGMEISVNADVFGIYAISEEGYHHLMEISTAIQKETFDFALFKDKTAGLVGIIDTKSGRFKEMFEADDIDAFSRYLYDVSVLFKDGFYLGIEITNKEEISYAKKVRAFAREHTYECVAFPKIRYLKKDDAIILKIAEAIADGQTLEEQKMDGQEYFMTIANYEKIYSQIEINNTKKVLEASSFNFHQKRGEMITFPVENSPEELKSLCYKALKELNLDAKEEYANRLNYELETIISLGYADYFLIVQDYVNHAKKIGILVGAGRGSAVGSLVSYLLNITQIDPLKYGLQFERFLNPFRQSMPDIDVDFMDTRREEMIDYMREKYGSERVANIVTFSTIQAKQALKDIGRIYGFSEKKDIKLFTDRLGTVNSLREAYKTLPAFKKLVDSDSYYLNIVSLASKIEGLIRQGGLHAAGIILNNSPLENALPVYVDFSNHYISQYEMDCLEDQGFLKMDFLGLRNLTTISYCVDLVNKNYPDAKLDKQNLPFEEKEIFDLIASGQTMGLFQINSSGMRNAIKILKPNCFDDIVALLALFRPGPMDSLRTYAQRKEGKAPIVYDDPCLEPILKSTYGVIVYQEQVNQIATAFAGFSVGEADLFRSAISKKKMEKILEGEKAFTEGAIKRGHNPKVVAKIYDDIKKFANYAFNKSHSVVYSMIACQMAYLKVHYPLEFYAAIMETSSSSEDSKFNEYVSEMKKRNLAVLLPDINLSTDVFSVNENGLMFPLKAIRGINALFVNSILEERSNGLFTDFFDFVARMFKYKISEAQLNKLIDAGCFDAFDKSRASFRASMKSALQYAELNYSETGQINIGISSILKPYLISDFDDPLENLDKEYEALGIMISNNPLHYKADILKSKKVITISEAKGMKNAKIAGLIRSVKLITTKKDKMMAFVLLADETDEIELTVFSDAYEESIDILKKNQLVIAQIKYEKRGETISYICDSVTPLEDEDYA